MTGPTPMDIDKELPARTTITMNEIRSIFEVFWSDPNNTNDPSKVPGRLLEILDETLNFNNESSNNGQTKSPEMREINNSPQKNLPGEAEPPTDQRPDPPAKPGQPETPPKDTPPKDTPPKDKKEKLQGLKETVKEQENIIKEMGKALDKEQKETENHKKELNSFKKKLDDAHKQLQEKDQLWIQKWNHLIKQYTDVEEQLKNKRKDFRDLSKKNQELIEEASQYQSALGDARNYRLSDNDANNPIQLTQDIGIIQDKINEFCKIKGGVEIYENNLALLLSEKYNCKFEPGDKVLPKAALQRLIFETIIGKTEEYLNNKLNPQPKEINEIPEKYLELEVLNSTNDYLSKINKLIDSRKGADEVSSAAPKKIRQLVNAVLGDRGFGLSNDKSEHEFVKELKDIIIVEMSKFRKIKNDDKRKENDDMLADIIRNVIKMFIFRIKVLEPPGEIKWFDNNKDSKIDPTLMEVGNLEDDNYDDWFVNLCYFPLIGVNLDSEAERKVLVQAKIMAIKVEKAEPKQGFIKAAIAKLSGTDSKPQQRQDNSHQNSPRRNSTDPKLIKNKPS